MILSDILKPGMKGAFYGRHSTEKQNMRSQRDSVLQLVKKYRCHIIVEYLDEGVSAVENELEEREGITQLLKDALENKFDFIAIQHSDRLARDPIEHISIKIKLMGNEIPIVISSSETVYDRKINNITQLMQDGFAKYEVENIKTRTFEGLQSRVRKGRFPGGNSPYGYKYLPKVGCFEPIEEELEYVREIYDLYKKGEGFLAISKLLPTGTNRGKDWSKEQVRNIIINPIYAGFVSYQKRGKKAASDLLDRKLWIIAPAQYIKPVVTKEEWEICWRIFNERSKRKVYPKNLKTNYVFKDIVKCKECNKNLETKDQRSKSSTNKTYGKILYRCRPCNLSIKRDELHDHVINNILNDVRLLTFEQVFDAICKQLKKEVSRLHTDIEKLNGTVEKLLGKQNQIKHRIKNLMQEQSETDSKSDKDKTNKLIGVLSHL